MIRYIFLTIFSLLAQQAMCAEHKSSVAIRGAAFAPSGGRFEHIYGHVMPSYQIEASTRLTKSLDAWINIDYLMKHGRSYSLHNPTRTNIANLSLGFKFPYKLNDAFTPYIGLGPSFGVIWLKNRSPYTHQNTAVPAIGVILKSGVHCFMNKWLFLDFFFDYLYQPAVFHNTVNIGGIKAGIGIGSKF